MAQALTRSQRTVRGILLAAAGLLLLLAVASYARADPAPVTVWRFYNRITGVHFYTADLAERSLVLANYPDLEAPASS